MTYTTEARRRDVPNPVIPPDCICDGCALTAAALTFLEAANATAPALVVACRTILRLASAGADRRHGLGSGCESLRADMDDGILVPVADYVSASVEFSGGEPEWAKWPRP